MDPRSEYLERFYDAVDAVDSGRVHAIDEDRRLVISYSADYASVMAPFLRHDNEDVRAELVSLFTEVYERSVQEDVGRMHRSDTQKVRDRCLGYLKTMEDADSRIPGLMDDLEHTRGHDYMAAAKALERIARDSDIDRVRTVYGQTEGDMQDAARRILEAILDRSPRLEPKRVLILSMPVYPDEAAFDRFLDGAVDYIDVRYRGNVHGRDSISLTTYNNIVAALNKIRIRLYNEADNLVYYGPDMADRHLELSELLVWALGDLSSKAVVASGEVRSRACPLCGGMMVKTGNGWACPRGC